MSVFTSVFKSRKGIQKRINNFTGSGRAQSPPSPASFVSPDVNDRAFNPYTLYGASQSSLNQPLPRQPSGPAESNSSSKFRIDFSTDELSSSNWFPQELLETRSDSPAPAPRPERNASLVAKTGTPSTGLGVNRDGGSHSRAASSSGHSHMDAAYVGVGSIPGSRLDVNQAGSSRDHQRSFAEDDVIIIEAPRGRDPALSPLASSFKMTAGGVPSPSDISAQRRQAPEPLQIPVYPGLSLHRQRTASVISLPLPSSYLDGVLDGAMDDGDASSLSRGHSISRSRRPSLARSRSRLYSRSRPVSTYSRYSDTELDYDDLSSAVSGTTLARALVSSYILSPSSAAPNSAQPYTRRGHLARQDSATLPRGEFPFNFTRKSLRSSVRSSKSSAMVSNHGSTYWKDRRISKDQIVLVSPDDRKRQGDSEVPPVPALPEGLSPEPSPYSSRSRKTSPNIESGRESPVGLTAAWRRSNGQRQDTATDLFLEPVPDKKRRRISKISEASSSHASSTLAASGTDLYPTSEGEGDSHSLAEGSYAEESTPENTTRYKGSPGGSSQRPLTGSPSTDDTNGYDTPGLSHSLSTTSANSVRTTNSGVSGIRSPVTRSFSDGSPRKSMGPRPAAPLLPIGSRARSSSIQSPTQPQGPRTSDSTRSHSFMSPLQPPTMPVASNNSPESPDLIDIMFANSRVVERSNGGVRVLSPPAPISVPPRDLPPAGGYGFLQYDPNSPSTASAVRQTFPETPYAFTPVGSAGFNTPALPPGAPIRTTSTTMRGGRNSKPDIAHRALMRAATMHSPPTSATLPMTPPASAYMADFQRSAAEDFAASSDAIPDPQSAGILSAIEEGSTHGSPISSASSYTNTPEHSPAPLSRGSASRWSLEVAATAAARPPSLIPAKRSLTPVSTPPASAVPLPPSPSPSPAVQDRYSLRPPPSPLAPSILESIADSQDFGSRSSSPARSIKALNPLPTPPASKLSRPGTFSSVASGDASSNKRFLRRPPPPSGPRKPSGPQSLINRSRNGSVSSVGSPPVGSAGSGSSSLPMYASGSASGGTSSASSPRFQTTQVKFRGLTMEAAQWTFSSAQLQETVSTAIKKSSDASTIRLLPTDLLNEQIPEEIARLQAHSAELRTSYKLAVRKRRMLLGSLRSIADGGELSEQAASARLLDDVTELSEHLDHISEELYSVTDQLTQLQHLQDVHFGSALAMALRKLNSSFIKHLAEKETLRQQVFALEAERDEAWRHAQEAARDLDDLTDKVTLSEGIASVASPTASRRSSKIIFARKASVRKAGLRSPSRLRSQRSSLVSASMSPAPRSTPNGPMVPPVPPIPSRMPLGISTSDLPSRGSAITSETSPTSELRAMQQAQQELCEMLGISPEDLRAPHVQTRPKRSASLSATMQSPASPRSFLTRSNSEIYTPKDTWRFQHRSQSVDDRTAVLASIGMSSA